MSPEARQAAIESLRAIGYPVRTNLTPNEEKLWQAACRYTWLEAAKIADEYWDGTELAQRFRERAQESA